MAKRKKKRTWRRRILVSLFKTVLVVVMISVGMTLLLRWVAPPTSSYMMQQRISGIPIDYRWVPLNRISPNAALAVIASEDQNFFVHKGLDFEAIGDAIEEKLTRNRLRGASTISQQVAKNLFLWQGKSFLRKGIEIYFTLVMETLWPKGRILEVYLNIAEMGKGVFGVEAAADRYFRKEAARLNRREAATLAAVLPNPKQMSAAHPSSYVRKRTGAIIKQMEALGGVGFLTTNGLNL